MPGSATDGRYDLRACADVITCIAVKYNPAKSFYRANADNHRFALRNRLSGFDSADEFIRV